MSKLTVAVLYGSRSPEHEVSIITAIQAMHNLDKNKYDIVPIYISKDGTWVIGDAKFLLPESYKDLTKLISGTKRLSLFPPKSLPKIDVALPVFHGAFGEDGTIQGFLEVLNTPYVGCGVVASSLGMDKVLQKEVFKSAGLSQVKHLWFYKNDWQSSPKTVLQKIKSLKYPLYVKPTNGGSSIGITKVKSLSELTNAIDVACFYDRKILVEESAEGFKEINISVLGNSGSTLKTSVCEQPVPSQEVLTFSDKYQSGNAKSAGMASAKRLIPAPIKSQTATKISETAKTAFQALDCSGLSRIDFLVSPNEKTIYINEINTIPGSLAFYLWEASGLKFPDLLDELINQALQKHQEKTSLTTTFPNNLLATLGETLQGGKLKG